MDERTSLGVCLATERIVAAIRQRLPGRERPLLVALDGGSGAGKSTLAAIVAREVAATVIGADDFFAAERMPAEWDALTPAETAGSIDWQRMRREAIEPLLAGNLAVWHPFHYDATRAAWHARWDPAENWYLTYVRPASSFDLVVQA